MFFLNICFASACGHYVCACVCVFANMLMFKLILKRVNISGASGPAPRLRPAFTLKRPPEVPLSKTVMVDAALSETNAPRWDFTEDAEETGAVGKFN